MFFRITHCACVAKSCEKVPFGDVEAKGLGMRVCIYEIEDLKSDKIRVAQGRCSQSREPSCSAL